MQLMLTVSDHSPLISVIITTYNYAAYLPKAIESVLNQTYGNVEIIVIDDGSTDDTVSVIKPHKAIRYIYQENAGLAAARNAGIKNSKGDYLVFLDADDWLQKDGLQANYEVIKGRREIAFVSGNYYLLRAATGQREQVAVAAPDNFYVRLLQGNYIGMHAAVMFQRWIFKEFQYDEALKACEDYDLYLRITRKYPVMHHQKFIATYYFHSKSMSHNHRLMMDSVNRVIKKQADFIRSPLEEMAYLEGLQQWKDYLRLMEKTIGA